MSMLYVVSESNCMVVASIGLDRIAPGFPDAGRRRQSRQVSGGSPVAAVAFGTASDLASGRCCCEKPRHAGEQNSDRAHRRPQPAALWRRRGLRAIGRLAYRHRSAEPTRDADSILIQKIESHGPAPRFCGWLASIHGDAQGHSAGGVKEALELERNMPSGA